MKTIHILIACALAGSSIVLGEAQIDPTYPPANDIRKPDRAVAPAGQWPVSALAYSPEGRTLAVATVNKVIQIRDARTGEQGTGEVLRTMDGDAGRVLALAFSSDGKNVIAVCDDQTVRTWDAATGKSLDKKPLKMPVRAVAIAPTTQPLMAEGSGGELKLWNYQTGESLADVVVHDFSVKGLSFLPDGKTLAVGTDKGPIILWDSETKTVKTNTLLPAPTNSAWAVSPKIEQFAAAGNDKTIKVWDVATGKLLCTQQGHAAAITAVAFNPNNQKMASGAADGSINYWTVPLPPVAPEELAKITAAVPTKAAAAPKKPRKILVFWRADAILHKVGVAAMNHAIEMMGTKTGAFESDFSRDYDALDPKILANYDAIVLNSTAHLAIPESAKKALLDYVNGGGGVIGVHAAIDTFRQWPEGSAIIGATFANHPWPPSGNWAVKLEEPNHPLLRAWGGKNFRMHDEMYEMGEPYSRADRRVLLTLDMSDPATAGVAGLHRTDKDFAVSWIKHAGKGRVFYCCFGGHTFDPFENPAVLQFYLDGIQYAVGDLEVDDTPKP